MYQHKLATLIVSCCMSMTMLFAQSPSASAQTDRSAAKFPAASAYANTKLTYKIFDTPKHTYGYDVFADGRLMIHQTSAPALPGNEGFKTKEDASKVAALELRDRVASVGLHRLQVWAIHYTAQIDIVAEVARSDRLSSVGLNLLLVRSVNDAIGVDIGC